MLSSRKATHGWFGWSKGREEIVITAPGVVEEDTYHAYPPLLAAHFKTMATTVDLCVRVSIALSCHGNTWLLWSERLVT